MANQSSKRVYLAVDSSEDENDGENVGNAAATAAVISSATTGVMHLTGSRRNVSSSSSSSSSSSLASSSSSSSSSAPSAYLLVRARQADEEAAAAVVAASTPPMKRQRTKVGSRTFKLAPASSTLLNMTSASDAQLSSSFGLLKGVSLDVLFIMLRFASLKDLVQISQVSKAIHDHAFDARAIGASVNLRFLSPDGKAGFSNVPVALERLNRGGQLRHVQLGHHQFGSTSISKLLKFVPLLASLDCGNSKKIDVGELNMAAAPHITTLRIGWCGENNISPWTRFLTGRSALKHLSIEWIFGMHGGGGFTDRFLALLAQQCPHLESLLLHGACDFTLAGMSALASGCKELTSFTVRNHADYMFNRVGPPPSCDTVAARALFAGHRDLKTLALYGFTA